jgi:hypothetical protein
MSDLVKAPNHYTWHPSGVECKDISGHFPHFVASAIEYLWRHNHKGTPLQDLRKARECIENEINRLEGVE